MGAEEGSVEIDGTDALGEPDALKGQIGYVPDFFGVYDNLTVGEYMSFFASCYRIDGLVARKRYTALLEQVGLEDKLDFYVDGLSRGMKQRLCLARALIHDPAILILDEPTAGLDPQGRDDILDQIAALHKMRGITIILVSHSMEDIAKYVERLIVMNHGKMVFDDTPKNVFSHYKELEGMGLAAPQITYIMHALSENGLNVDTTATTVEEARDTILEALKKQKPSLLKKGGRSE